MQCAEPVNIEARELFADALERAVFSEYGAVNDNSWADHPYYDDHDSPETVHDDLDGAETLRDDRDCPETARAAENLFHDCDLDSSETVDIGETNEYDEDVSGQAELPDDVPWEDHPYYDTPAEEEECDTESDDSVEDAACQADSTYDEEEDEVPWEDSPYY